MRNWISVKDRLPPEAVKVLVFISTGPGETCWDMAVMYRYQHWCWRSYGRVIEDEKSDPSCREVTHWMELPNRPETP